MSYIWYKREKLSYFDEFSIYNGYALVNEIYEDEDCRKNTWMWGKIDGDYIIDARMLEGLSSKSYAPWEEVQLVFKKTIDTQ